MRWANEFELTTKNYIWIATQSVIGKERRASQEFPPGMLGTKTITIDNNHIRPCKNVEKNFTKNELVPFM